MRTDADYPLLSVEEAERRVLACVAPLPAVDTPLLEALDQVLAEDILAPRDVPPCANSAMDGYAVHHADLAPGVELPVVGYVAAGHAWAQPLAAGSALRIMTGAPLPDGADTVVRFEDATPLDGAVRINVVPRPGRNVRAAGEDLHAGELALPAGRLLRPQEIGLLASLGRATVPVHRPPVVAVLSTGDEVTDVGAPLPPGCIYDSNSYTLAAQIARAGGRPLVLAPAPDRREALTARLQEAVSRADLIVTSGGVSVGDFDLVKDVLTTAGRMDFWWVNMKPGKPLAFGQLGGVPLLALPGNPVAAMLSFHLFGRPAVLKMRGLADWAATTIQATMAEAIERKDGRRHYLRVRLRAADGGWLAELTGEQGSGILSSLTAGQGVAVIPESRECLPAGSTVTVMVLD